MCIRDSIRHRHAEIAEFAVLHQVTEEVLLPERDHLQQDVLNLGAENLVDAERTLDLGLQLAVLKVPAHRRILTAIAGFFHIAQHIHLGGNVIDGGDHQRDGIAVLEEAEREVVLIAQALQLFLLGLLVGNFAHDMYSFQQSDEIL